jgi:hypothetical protein
VWRPRQAVARVGGRCWRVGWRWVEPLPHHFAQREFQTLRPALAAHKFISHRSGGLPSTLTVGFADTRHVVGIACWSRAALFWQSPA